MVTVEQVQNLITQIPSKQLPIAYKLLLNLVAKPPTEIDAVTLMQLPLAERRRILRQQAAAAIADYQADDERMAWQVGDFFDDQAQDEAQDETK